MPLELMGSTGDGEQGAGNGGAVISMELEVGWERGRSLKPSVDRSETGARGESIPPVTAPLSSGSAQGRTEGCEDAEQTLGLIRTVRFVRCCSGA